MLFRLREELCARYFPPAGDAALIFHILHAELVYIRAARYAGGGTAQPHANGVPRHHRCERP